MALGSKLMPCFAIPVFSLYVRCTMPLRHSLFGMRFPHCIINGVLCCVMGCLHQLTLLTFQPTPFVFQDGDRLPLRGEAVVVVDSGKSASTRTKKHLICSSSPAAVRTCIFCRRLFVCQTARFKSLCFCSAPSGHSPLQDVV